LDLLNLFLLFLAGCGTGFLAGFFGVGGGVILVPLLLYYFHSIGVSSLVATHLTFGTSLLVVIFASSSSAYNYWRNGHVVWRGVLLIGLASVVGASLGATIAAGLQAKTLQQVFGTVVAITAIRLLVEEGHRKKDPHTGARDPGMLGAGFVTGIVSSLAGVGGGVISIPLMYYLLGFPLKKAVGTSSATIVITASAAAVGYTVEGWGNPLLPDHTLGFVDYTHALPLIIGAIPLASLGATVAQKTHVDRLRRFFAVFLLVVAIKMFLF